MLHDTRHCAYVHTSSANDLDVHTIHAYELESEFQDRTLPITVTAKCPLSTSWKTWMNAIGSSQRPILLNSDAEARDPGPQETRYIVVGVVPVLTPSDEDLATLGARGREGTERPKRTLSPPWKVSMF